MFHVRRLIEKQFLYKNALSQRLAPTAAMCATALTTVHVTTLTAHVIHICVLLGGKVRLVTKVSCRLLLNARKTQINALT